MRWELQSCRRRTLPRALTEITLLHHDDTREAGPDEFYPDDSSVRIHHPNRSAGKILFIAEGVPRFRSIGDIREK